MILSSNQLIWSEGKCFNLCISLVLKQNWITSWRKRTVACTVQRAQICNSAADTSTLHYCHELQTESSKKVKVACNTVCTPHLPHIFLLISRFLLHNLAFSSHQFQKLSQPLQGSLWYICCQQPSEAHKTNEIARITQSEQGNVSEELLH